MTKIKKGTIIEWAAWSLAKAAYNKRMLLDWFSAALQTSRKCER